MEQAQTNGVIAKTYHQMIFGKKIEINTIIPQSNSVKIIWDWGKGVDWEWLNDEKKDFPLEVVKETNVWKISYMDWFDPKYY